ncbi:MAG: glycosyltransferase family 4 protein, partial [Anaerolineae bacterium]|nr:glycosyltransferase family 4 protein [Anaerolineae bacterium]
NALFFRDNHPCEDCLGKTVPWPGVWHACYRRSHMQSAVVASMLAYHHWLATWKTQVDMYIALSEFSRQKFIEGGIAPEKIAVKPNFVMDREYSKENGDYVVFVGRLSREKGLFTLLNAWRRLSHIPLIIIGGGPLHGELQTLVEKENLNHIRLLGRLPNSDALKMIRHARFLVFPTEWYETFGRVVIEAYSMGLPVIASRIGAVTELIHHDNETGLLFNAGDPIDLAEKVDWLWKRPKESARMGKGARKEYEEKYTPERNFEMLMNIYSKVIKDHKS